MGIKKYPQRGETHSLEDASLTFFRQHLPNDWNLNVISKDYGQDLNIEIAENGSYRGLELVVQLKGAATSNATNNTERQRLKVSTYNYLWDNLRVVLIVKYVEDVDEAYWILLKDVPEPNQSNETFTINIPIINLLSTLNWNSIKSYVRSISEKKLKAVRPKK